MHDLIETGTDLNILKDIIFKFRKCFKMKEKEILTYFVGFEIDYNKDEGNIACI